MGCSRGGEGVYPGWWVYRVQYPPSTHLGIARAQPIHNSVYFGLGTVDGTVISPPCGPGRVCAIPSLGYDLADVDLAMSSLGRNSVKQVLNSVKLR